MVYRLIRNEPSHSGLFGVTLMPANILVSYLNIGVSAGIGAFYTYESKFGVSVNYQRAYVDDIAGSSRDNIPGGDAESYGIPANYSKSSLLDIQTKMAVFSWEKEGDYNLKLGNTKVGGVHADVIGDRKSTRLNSSHRR